MGSAYFRVWDGSPDKSELLMAMVRGDIVNENVSSQLTDFIQSRLVDGTKGRCCGRFRDRTQSRLRISRLISGVPLLAGADTAVVIGIIAPAIPENLAPHAGSRSP